MRDRYRCSLTTTFPGCSKIKKGSLEAENIFSSHECCKKCKDCCHFVSHFFLNWCFIVRETARLVFVLKCHSLSFSIGANGPENFGTKSFTLMTHYQLDLTYRTCTIEPPLLRNKHNWTRLLMSLGVMQEGTYSTEVALALLIQPSRVWLGLLEKLN